jgi:5-methylcytosine-specific restriction endonuclease McrA
MNATKFTKAKMAALVKPNAMPNVNSQARLLWLSKAKENFVNPSIGNKEKYEVILQALWPEGHGIPGPIVTQDDIRAAIDDFQTQRGEKPYKDPFRRMRELQGEEGFLCIVKEGVRYQLVSTSLTVKRTPRAKLPTDTWNELLKNYGHRCVVCARDSNEVRLNQDHKIPRTRDGYNDLENWQPLCDECNNIKSTQCRGCELNCYTCTWAFPETYPRLQINDSNKEMLIRESEKQGVPINDVLNKLLAGELTKKYKK